MALAEGARSVSNQAQGEEPGFNIRLNTLFLDKDKELHCGKLNALNALVRQNIDPRLEIAAAVINPAADNSGKPRHYFLLQAHDESSQKKLKLGLLDATLVLAPRQFDMQYEMEQIYAERYAGLERDKAFSRYMDDLGKKQGQAFLELDTDGNIIKKIAGAFASIMSKKKNTYVLSGREEMNAINHEAETAGFALKDKCLLDAVFGEEYIEQQMDKPGYMVFGPNFPLDLHRHARYALMNPNNEVWGNYAGDPFKNRGTLEETMLDRNNDLQITITSPLSDRRMF